MELDSKPANKHPGHAIAMPPIADAAFMNCMAIHGYGECKLVNRTVRNKPDRTVPVLEKTQTGWLPGAEVTSWWSVLYFGFQPA